MSDETVLDARRLGGLFAELSEALEARQQTGYTTPEEGIALLESRYPPWLLLPRHRYIVQDVAARATQGDDATDQHS